MVTVPNREAEPTANRQCNMRCIGVSPEQSSKDVQQNYFKNLHRPCGHRKKSFGLAISCSTTSHNRRIAEAVIIELSANKLGLRARLWRTTDVIYACGCLVEQSECGICLSCTSFGGGVLALSANEAELCEIPYPAERL